MPVLNFELEPEFIVDPSSLTSFISVLPQTYMTYSNICFFEVSIVPSIKIDRSLQLSSAIHGLEATLPMLLSRWLSILWVFAPLLLHTTQIIHWRSLITRLGSGWNWSMAIRMDLLNAVSSSRLE